MRLILYWSCRFLTLRKSFSLVSYCWKLGGILCCFCEDVEKLVLLSRELLKKWDCDNLVSVVKDCGFCDFIYVLCNQLDKL